MTSAVFQIFRAVLCVVLIVAATFVVAGVESTGVGSTLGGGGATSITSGTTPVTGGADTQVCYNDAGTMSCGDAGLVYTKGTDTIGVLGGIELGHATDTTLARSAAGVVTIEGGTVAKLNTANSWTAVQTFTAGPVIGPNINAVLGDDSSILGSAITATAGFATTRTILTPDSGALFTGSLSNSIHIFEVADNFDFNNGSCGTSACTNPTLILHSRNQTTTEWIDIKHNGTNGVIDVGTGVVDFPDGMSLSGGHIVTGGTAPVISSCGTTPSTVTGNDIAGRFTWGSGGADASCTLTFATAYTVAPKCFANNETTVVILRAVASTTALEIDAALAASVDSDVITYFCIQ